MVATILRYGSTHGYNHDVCATLARKWTLALFEYHFCCITLNGERRGCDPVGLRYISSAISTRCNSVVTCHTWLRLHRTWFAFLFSQDMLVSYGFLDEHVDNGDSVQLRLPCVPEPGVSARVHPCTTWESVPASFATI